MKMMQLKFYKVVISLLVEILCLLIVAHIPLSLNKKNSNWKKAVLFEKEIDESIRGFRGVWQWLKEVIMKERSVSN